jgi:hypothetical protein
MAPLSTCSRVCFGADQGTSGPRQTGRFVVGRILARRHLHVCFGHADPNSLLALCRSSCLRRFHNSLSHTGAVIQSYSWSGPQCWLLPLLTDEIIPRLRSRRPVLFSKLTACSGVLANRALERRGLDKLDTPYGCVSPTFLAPVTS